MNNISKELIFPNNKHSHSFKQFPGLINPGLSLSKAYDDTIIVGLVVFVSPWWLSNWFTWWISLKCPPWILKWLLLCSLQCFVNLFNWRLNYLLGFCQTSQVFNCFGKALYLFVWLGFSFINARRIYLTHIAVWIKIYHELCKILQHCDILTKATTLFWSAFTFGNYV